MSRSFKHPNGRTPNFGIEGAMPQTRPAWLDRNWRTVPPTSPPWSPPPLPPREGPDPFGVPPPSPSPLQPRSDEQPAPAGRDLIDSLFGAPRASRERNGAPPPAFNAGRYTPDPFMDARPWRAIEPDPGLVQTLPFNSRQLAALLQTRPEDLVQSASGMSSKKKVVQPPIFFPFD
jgi:hypothetical protein